MTVEVSPQPLSRRLLLIVVTLMLLALAARALPGPRTVDDAFITFRYARNLVEGQGFVYNPGVHTLGTTTPLFTLLMAAISAITGGQEFPHYAIAVSTLADMLTTVLLFLLARRLTGNDWVAIIPAALWAVSPRSVTFVVGGMETAVNILWMVAAFWLYAAPPQRPAWVVRYRPVLIGLCATLGYLTRIDALLWIAPLFLALLLDLRRARWPLITGVTFALALAPWLLFSLSYFGSPFPNSLSAKSVAYTMPPGAALITFIQNYATPFFEYDTFGIPAIAIGALAYLVLSLLALLYTARRLPRLLPFLLYTWLYLVAFSVANPLIFRWYLLPPVPALMLGIVTGVWSLVSRADTEQRRVARRFAPVALGGLALLWGFTSLNAWQLHPDHGLDRPAPAMAWHKIELLYQDYGTALREEYDVTPQTRVASADIGAVGYFSRATIVDTVGLVTPELVRYYPNPPELIPDGQNYAIPPGLIFDMQPDFIVTMEAFVRLGLEPLPQFAEEYELVQETPTDFYGTGMRLYRRRAA